MKRIVHLVGILAFGAAAVAPASPMRTAAKGSTSYVPALGYISNSGRSPSLVLANEDGSGAQTAYRFSLSGTYDLTSASRHLIAVADGHSIYMLGWSLSGSTLVPTARTLIFATSGGVYGGAPAFSPDGSKLAYYTSDGFVHVIDSSTRQELVRFASDFANEINWMPDGNSIVVLSPDSTSTSNYLTEYPASGGPGTVLLHLQSISSFDTGRVPGDRKILISYSQPGFSSIMVGLYDGTSITNLRANGGYQVNWKCDLTKFAFKNSSNSDGSLYAYIYSSGAWQQLVSSRQGQALMPRYMKCDAATLLLNAQRLGGRRF